MKMNFRKIYLCYCKDCEEYFIGEEKRWVMYYCPHCKVSAVDIEDGYSRMIGNCDILKKIQIPKTKMKKVPKKKKGVKK